MKAPKTLKGRGLDEWNRVAPILETAGRLTAGNATCLECYCRWVAMFDLVMGDAEATDDPKLRAELLRRADGAAGRVREMAKEFGLTPRSAQMMGDKPMADDGLAEFL